MGRWTFSAKLGAALSLMVVLTAAVGGFAAYALRAVVESKDQVIDINADNLMLAEQLARLTQQQRAAARDYLLSVNEQFAAELQQIQANVDTVLQQLDANGISTAAVRGQHQAYRTLI